MNREYLWLWVLLLCDNIRCLTGGQKLIHYFKALCFLCNRRQMKNREYLNGHFDRNIVWWLFFCFQESNLNEGRFCFPLRTFAKKKKKKFIQSQWLWKTDVMASTTTSSRPNAVEEAVPKTFSVSNQKLFFIFPRVLVARVLFQTFDSFVLLILYMHQIRPSIKEWQSGLRSNLQSSFHSSVFASMNITAAFTKPRQIQGSAVSVSRHRGLTHRTQMFTGRCSPQTANTKGHHDFIIPLLGSGGNVISCHLEPVVWESAHGAA